MAAQYSEEFLEIVHNDTLANVIKSYQVLQEKTRLSHRQMQEKLHKNYHILFTATDALTEMSTTLSSIKKKLDVAKETINRFTTTTHLSKTDQLANLKNALKSYERLQTVSEITGLADTIRRLYETNKFEQGLHHLHTCSSKAKSLEYNDSVSSALEKADLLKTEGLQHLIQMLSTRGRFWNAQTPPDLDSWLAGVTELLPVTRESASSFLTNCGFYNLGVRPIELERLREMTAAVSLVADVNYIKNYPSVVLDGFLAFVKMQYIHPLSDYNFHRPVEGLALFTVLTLRWLADLKHIELALSESWSSESVVEKLSLVDIFKREIIMRLHKFGAEEDLRNSTKKLVSLEGLRNFYNLISSEIVQDLVDVKLLELINQRIIAYLVYQVVIDEFKPQIRALLTSQSVQSIVSGWEECAVKLQRTVIPTAVASHGTKISQMIARTLYSYFSFFKLGVLMITHSTYGDQNLFPLTSFSSGDMLSKCICVPEEYKKLVLPYGLEFGDHIKEFTSGPEHLWGDYRFGNRLLSLIAAVDKIDSKARVEAMKHAIDNYSTDACNVLLKKVEQDIRIHYSATLTTTILSDLMSEFHNTALAIQFKNRPVYENCVQKIVKRFKAAGFITECGCEHKDMLHPNILDMLKNSPSSILTELRVKAKVKNNIRELSQATGKATTKGDWTHQLVLHSFISALRALDHPLCEERMDQEDSVVYLSHILWVILRLAAHVLPVKNARNQDCLDLIIGYTYELYERTFVEIHPGGCFVIDMLSDSAEMCANWLNSY